MSYVALATDRIADPDAGQDRCFARCHRVAIDGTARAAVITPAVSAYPTNKVELIAPVNLREELGVTDGDVVALQSTRPHG